MEELIDLRDEIECTQYSGGRPSVAMNNNGVVVQIYENHSSLFWCVGKLGRLNIIEWGSSCKFDSGINPHVAINSYGYVVEVHQSQKHSTLWYHVGKVNADSKSIDWGSSQQYDDGITPSVAINDYGKVVEVHETDSKFSTSLFYRVGDFNTGTKKIHFSESGSREYTIGKNPSVTLNKSGQVIEVHVSQGMKDTLWYKVGTISGDRIGFGGSIRYDEGASPSIALTDEGKVIEAHKSESHETLFFHHGMLTGSTLYLGVESHRYGRGKNPSVAAASLNGSTKFTRDQTIFITTVFNCLQRMSKVSILMYV